MPLFFFDVQIGSSAASEDMDGINFDSLETAEREAITAAAEMAKDRFSHGPGRLLVEVRDDSGVRSTVVVVMEVNRS
jgi:hypothetical protein